VNKKRLYKSSNAVIGGVCGGIAEYFGIDPTLVRIIAVALLIVAWGIPLVFYLVLLVALPPDPGAAQGYVDARAVSTDQPPPPDPATRVSAYRTQASHHSATWVTQSVTDTAHTVANSVKSNSSAVLVVGAVLIGVGVIALLSNFVHISIWRFWPAILIMVGLVSLFTPSHNGWSLERAGNSIALISIGLALLAWMLQIIQTRVLVAAFLGLWPVLLISLGIAIIGAARKSSILFLASSLVFSATIILGLWVYGGLDWVSLGETPLLKDSDGIQELLADLKQFQ
jgi:phage shock protein C